MFTTTSFTPAATSRSMEWSIRVLPPTVTSGLGRSSVRGRIRNPSPAPMIIAAVTLLTLFLLSKGLHHALVFWNHAIIPCPQSAQGWMRQVPFQVIPDAGQERQITLPAVAFIEAGE